MKFYSNIKIRIVVSAAVFILLFITINNIPYSLSIEIQSPNYEIYQIFFDIGNGFNKSDSIASIVYKNKGLTKVTLNLPKKNIKRLRIDPGIHCGNIIIKSISINSSFRILNNTPVLYKWSAKDILKDFKPVHHISSFIVKEDFLYITSTGNDPHFVTTVDFKSIYERLRSPGYTLDKILLYIFALFISAVIFFIDPIYSIIVLKIHLLLKKTRLKKLLLISLLLFIVVFSLGLRLININSHILSRYGFRQTQTAISTWMMVENGVSFFSYQTPIFGPPWQVPFEFPLFQACVTLLVKCGIDNIDVAGRLINILFFYLSVIFLFLLCNTFFKKSAISFIILSFYLLCPFMIFWSRTFMIDYASVFFSLGYFYFFVKLLDSEKWQFLVLAILFGIFAYSVKVTTILTALIPILVFSLEKIWIKLKNENFKIFVFLKMNKFFLLSIFFSLLIPFIAGYLWCQYTDSIRSSNIFTKFLSTSNLTHWLYGTWHQKFDIDYWKVIFNRIQYFFIPGITIIFLPIGLWFILKYSKRCVYFFYSAFFASFITIFTFFRLYYSHEYYLIAISPLVSIFIGFGIYQFFFVLLKKKYSLILISVFLILFYYNKQMIYLQPEFKIKYDHNVVELGNFLNEITKKNEYMIITDNAFNSNILYYAKRKGFMYRTNTHQKLLKNTKAKKFLRNPNFTIIVYKKEHKELFSLWKYKALVASMSGYKIMKISNKSTIQNSAEIRR